MLCVLSDSGQETLLEEFWYKSKYSYEEIDDQLYQDLFSPEKFTELHLPDPNPYLPESANLISAPSDDEGYPYILEDSKGLKLYYGQDIEFQRPKASYRYKIYFPKKFTDLQSYTLMTLYVAAVNESMNEASYPARLAGMDYEVSNDAEGISVIVNGYSDSIDDLLIEILNNMKSINIPNEQFLALRDKMIRDWQNIDLGDAYRIARESVPGLQLALLGLSQATDDPEGAKVFQTVADHAAGDPDIHLYFDPAEMPVSVDEVVNAVQMASAVLIQKSTREGFGLTVTEAMWKGKPVIGGDASGIRVQINDGVTGFLVSSPEQCAQRLVELLQDDALSARIGVAAKESVRQRFLLPRLALDYLRVARAHVNGRIPAVSDD